MQVMPFWPEQLGMQRHQLVQIEANMRMGCAILRFYLRHEHNDVRKALARYNGSIGASRVSRPGGHPLDPLLERRRRPGTRLEAV